MNSTPNAQVQPWGTSRRGLLGAGAVAAGVGLAGALPGGTAAAGEAGGDKPGLRPKPTALPRQLRPGDRVRVVSPASTPSRDEMARGLQILRGWGLEVEVAPHVYDELSWLAGTDEDRLADLNDAIRDPNIRAVFASRGGAGAQRVVERMDVAAAAADPKPLIGFSDITILQLALYARAGIPATHGPMVNWDADNNGPVEAEALRRTLMTTEEVRLERDAGEQTAKVKVAGRAKGTLLGGNLSLIAAAVGTTGFPSLDGAIFLVEEVGEAPYRVDRMLTQLRNSGSLDGIAGVAVGQFVDAEPDPGKWNIVELLRDRLGDLGVPVLGGLRIGHGASQLTAPVGTRARLDADAGTLTIEPGVRR